METAALEDLETRLELLLLVVHDGVDVGERLAETDSDTLTVEETVLENVFISVEVLVDVSLDFALVDALTVAEYVYLVINEVGVFDCDRVVESPAVFDIVKDKELLFDELPVADMEWELVHVTLSLPVADHDDVSVRVSRSVAV